MVAADDSRPDAGADDAEFVGAFSPIQIEFVGNGIRWKCSRRVLKLAGEQGSNGAHVSALIRKIKRDERVNRTARQTVRLAPHLDDPKFRPLIQSFARVSLLGFDVYEHIRANGLTNEDGEVRDSVQKLTTLIATQLKLATALGLTPAALDKFNKSKPLDLASAMAAHDEEVVDGDNE